MENNENILCSFLHLFWFFKLVPYFYRNKNFCNRIFYKNSSMPYLFPRNTTLKIRHCCRRIFLEGALLAVKTDCISDRTTHQKISNNHLTISTLLYPTNCRIHRTVNGPTFKFLHIPLFQHARKLCVLCFVLRCRRDSVFQHVQSAVRLPQRLNINPPCRSCEFGTNLILHVHSTKFYLTFCKHSWGRLTFLERGKGIALFKPKCPEEKSLFCCSRFRFPCL